jgi:hypothetical protein
MDVSLIKQAKSEHNQISLMAIDQQVLQDNSSSPAAVKKGLYGRASGSANS